VSTMRKENAAKSSTGRWCCKLAANLTNFIDVSVIYFFSFERDTVSKRYFFGPFLLRNLCKFFVRSSNFEL